MILLAGLALRLVHFQLVRNAFFFQRPFLDADFYHRWALEIAGGDWVGLHRGIFAMSPGYSYLLAALYSLFGAGITTAVLAQFLLGIACGWMIYLLGRKHLSREAGLVGAAIFLLYPPELFFESTLLKPVLINAVTLGSLLAASTAQPAWCLTAGFLTGCSAHLRPTALLLVPVIALWLWRRSARRLPALALLGGGLFLALLPVALRNHAVGGEWVWTTAHGGMNFYTGNSPESRGPYEMLPFARTDTADEQEAFLQEARRRSGRELTPAQASRFWYAESLRFIRREPVREAALLLKKAVIFLNGYEAPINMDYNFLRRELGPVLALPLFSFAVLLPLAVLGMARAAPHALLLGSLATVFLANIVFLTSSEYRFPAVPLLCLYAGHAVCAVARDVRGRAVKPLLLSWGSLALLLALTSVDVYAHLPGLSNYKRTAAANSLYNQGLEYHLAGRDEEAIRDYLRSESFNPDDPVLQNNLGIVLARRGRLAEAVLHFRKALPGFPDAHYNLGRTLTLLGRHEEAREPLRQAEIIARGRRP
ncbi:MAG TPA: glycosyltransferase family 39 protein [Candidatus Methanoperedens sp.]|nr:glycosyltransferase family 39 protein [Candidatus Methanoperedens sp.]